MASSSLDDLQLVATVVAAGTLAGAARQLKVTPSAVSKQLARVEERLGTRLFQRTTRQLRPTAAGLRYAAHAASVREAVETAEEDARAESGAPRGTLVVSAPLVLGQEILAALVARYLVRYPEVRVDLRIEDRHVDLVAEKVDVAVRVAPTLPASGLVARRLARQRFLLVASPAYLATAPALERAADLSSHACIDAHSAADMGAWRVVEGGRARTVRVSGRFVLSNVVAVERAAIAGAGVARIPEYLARHALAKGTLVEVLPRVSLPTRTLHAVHPAGKKTPERVRTFLAFLVDELPRALVP